MSWNKIEEKGIKFIYANCEDTESLLARLETL